MVGGAAQNIWDADTKLDKITTPTFEPITGADNVGGETINGVVYFVKYDGTNKTAPVGVQAAPYTMPARDSGGNFYVQDPTIAYHCANKRYVEENFVAKQERTDTARAALYGIARDGTPKLFIADAGQMADKVALTDGYGCLYVADPKFDSHAATKRYVDKEITKVSELVNALGIKSPTAVYEGYCGSN
jgi:hypothetical protein